MIATSVKCDVCGAERGPSNHWLVAGTVNMRWFEVHPWDDGLAAMFGYRHICGAACAHKVLDRYLESLRTGEGQ